MYVDDEGLRWAVRETQSIVANTSGHPELYPAVELVCLDDSALKKEIRLASATTFHDFKTQFGDYGVSELIKVVKSTFRELEERGTEG